MPSANNFLPELVNPYSGRNMASLDFKFSEMDRKWQVLCRRHIQMHVGK